MIEHPRFVGTNTPAVAASRSSSSTYLAVKRAIDVLAAGVGLVLLAPLLLGIALWIRLDSPGPAIYRQRRVGRHGREFVLLKFRTMRQGTPTLPTDQMARRADRAVTRAGRWLRRSSLDELPQLVNVLRGEMSIVGPRPALPCQTVLNAAREAADVTSLRPGITGWAQVCGRDDLSDAEKAACDVHYRRHVSFWLDGHIVLRTVAAVFSGRGTR